MDPGWWLGGDDPTRSGVAPSGIVNRGLQRRIAAGDQSVSGSAGGNLNTTTSSSSPTTAPASPSKRSSTPSSPIPRPRAAPAAGTAWRIVDRCGGSIQIDSSPESGTTVLLRFETVGTDATEQVMGADMPTATDFATDVLSESNR